MQAQLEAAPKKAMTFFESMLVHMTIEDVSAEALQLQSHYLQAGIVSEKWAGDALHVAMATVGSCSMIVSWNFQHIVHFDKIPQYNAVNTLRGYLSIAIYSPREVIVYEDQDL